MAKEPFFKINFRKPLSKTATAWEGYTQIYGSWMANAFKNQKKTKERFLCALDSLHENHPKASIRILDSEIKELCKTEEDKTAWLFFMGLAHEATEQYAKAFLYFIAASEYDPQSYMIYRKLADCACHEGLFGFAEQNYQEAIRLFQKEKNTELSVLSVLYSSLASCLTMMHEYESAEKALGYAEKTEIKTPEEQSARVILYAVNGDYEKAESTLKFFLKQKDIREDYGLQKKIDDIRAGADEQFCTMSVENSEIRAFWVWFSNRIEAFKTILDEDQAEDISEMTLEISERLKQVFPFTQRSLHVSAYKDGSYLFFVSDFYAKALSDGLTELFSKMPERFKEAVRWIKIH